MARVAVYGPLRGRLWSLARLRGGPAGRAERAALGRRADLRREERQLVEVRDLRLSWSSPSALLQASLSEADDPAEWLFEARWQPKALAAVGWIGKHPGTTLILSDRGSVGQTLARRLEALGQRVLLVSREATTGRIRSAVGQSIRRRRISS